MPTPSHALSPATVEPLPGVQLPAAAWTKRAERLLPLEAIGLVARLHRDFDAARRRLLAARRERQRAWDAGALPGWLPAEALPEARGEWRIAPLPADLLRRRVEITGPVNSTKMVIQMLSRGADGARADAAMLDFEDSMRPTWEGLLDGLDHAIGAARGELEHVQPASAGAPEKVYRLDPADQPLTMFRVRGLHLAESNLEVDGLPVAGGLAEAALLAFHTARALAARGRTPKLYIPKCEHHLEARWWNELLAAIEASLELPRGAIRVTFLIETLPAAFQCEEILWEARERVTALNVGRWDKIFSDLKVLYEHPDRVLADRATISLERPWMRAYAENLIRVCHRRGAFGMGGMAAFTPGKTAERRAEQTAKVVADKRFEAALGHDGLWVSHPFFIAPAMSAFERDHQLDVAPAVDERPDLLPKGTPPHTLDGLRKNVRVGIAYLQGWNDGLGCIAWDDLMEDLATLEISRAQVGQWLRHGVPLDDGPRVDRDLLATVFAEELARIERELADALPDAAALDAARRSFRAAAREAEAIFAEQPIRPFLSEASPRLA
jgi:malate synthase